MEQIRRILTLLVATASGLSFAFFALIVESMFLDGVGSDAWIGVLIMVINLIVIWIVNHMHDGTPLKNLKVRWCANTLFYTMILMIMEALIHTLQNRSISDSTAILYEFGYAAAVATALRLYHKTIGSLYPDSERIRILSTKNVRYKGRRTYMLVTESHLEKGMCHCTGQLIGQIRMLDQLYVYTKGMPCSKARVVQIHKDGNRLSDAKGGKNVTLVVNLRKQLKPFTVLSDVREAFMEKPEVFAENPRIVGLSSFFGECYRNGEYLSALAEAMMHGHYIVPCRVKLEGRGNIAAALPPNLNVSVPSVSRNDRAGERILPVFTDWDGVSKWKPFVESAESSVMLVDYQRMISLYENTFDGIAVNPFNEVSFYLAEDLIALIRRFQIEENS